MKKDNKILEFQDKIINEYYKIDDMIKEEIFESLAIPKERFENSYNSSLSHSYMQYAYYSGLLVKEPQKFVLMHVDINEDFSFKEKIKRFIQTIRKYFRKL